MIQNCVFDLGNVLVRYEPDAYVARFVPNPEQAAVLSRQLFSSGHWKAGDRGTMTRCEIIRTLCAEDPSQASLIAKIMEHCDEMLERIESSMLLLHELHKAGLRLYFLSNTNESAFSYMQGHGFFSYFSGGIASCREGLLKPDPAIYRLLLLRYRLSAESCVFCDDMAENTATAQKLGFAVVTLDDPAHLRQKLCAFPDINAALNQFNR